MNEEITNAMRKYAERVRSYSDQIQSWNEVDVKGCLVEPFFAALLWDPTDRNFVRREYPVTMGSETKHADYALMSGDTPICIVEAKAGELDDFAAREALSYARNLDVPWALVTNGQRMCLYGVEFYTAENTVDALIMDITISPESIDSSLDYLKYLSNGMIDSEEVYNVFKTFNKRKTLLAFLKSKKDTMLKVVSDWVEKQWNKGPVDGPLLSSSLEIVFGGDKPIYENPHEMHPPTSRGTVVVASDWKYRRDLGKGVFELKTDPTKRIDVSLPGPDVEHQLEKLGLRVSKKGAFGGFYYNLRREADLIKRK